MHIHTVIIDQVGTKSLRDLGASDQQIYNWRKRGISWRYRYPIAKIAEERGLALPDGFLTSPPVNDVGVKDAKHIHMTLMLRNQPDLSNVSIAKLAGVGEGYVRKHRKLMETPSA